MFHHSGRSRSAILQVLLIVFSLTAAVPAQVRPVTPNTVFSNNTSVTINAVPSLAVPTTASVYPSQITVAGMTGTITRVAVTLNGVSHQRMNDLDVLLVGPTGAKYIFLSDASGTINVDDRVWTFADDAAGTIGTNTDPQTGSYKPTSGDGTADTFPSPAPAGPYSQPNAATFASVFNGTDPNGNWTLYVADDATTSAGSINSGWSMSITTDGAPATFANNTFIGVFDNNRPASPYGTPISVAGQTGGVTDINVTLTGLTLANPQFSRFLLVSPNGRSLVLMAGAGSSAPVSNVNLTFDDSAANSVPIPIVTGTYKPTDNTFTTQYFPGPAPLAPYYGGGFGLSVFNGFSPNGEWRLFVMSSATTTSGSIAGGWSIDITTGPIPPPPPGSCSAASFAPTNFPVGINPTNVAVADYNNDGKADLAVTNQVSNDVSILLGNGNGTMQPQTLLSAGSGPYAIAAGKFNADNNFDLAVTNSGSNTVAIYPGNGNGTFGAPSNFFVGASPLSIATADFNNDSKQDLIVANFGSFFSGTVSVLLGTGTGAFTAGTSIRTRTQPSFVMTANLNPDGNKDVIVANFGSDSVSTFLGNGNGTFVLSQNIATGSGPVAVELADLGGDGIADLIVANYNSDSVTSCTGNANGIFTFCSSNNPSGGPNPISIAAADFLNSGTKTYATAMSGTNVVRVTSNDVTVGENPNAVRVADFNTDGKPDIVSVNFGSNDISILLNSCQVARGNYFDYSGDRRTDFSVYRPSNSNWYVSSLNSSAAVLKFARPTDTIVPADYDGDRLTDFAFFRPENGLWFVVDRTNSPIYFTQFGLANDIPVPGDFDGDGRADIAVWRPSDGNWYIRQSSDNSLSVRTLGSNGDRPVAADFDGDGKDDVAIFRPSTGVWYVWRSSDSQFYIRQFGMAGDKTAAGDYDGDGKADIAVFRTSTSVWYVLKSSNDDFMAVAWGVSGDVPVIGDYEGDGKYDFAIWRPSDSTWYVRKSSDGGGLYFTWGVAGDVPTPNAYVR